MQDGSPAAGVLVGREDHRAAADVAIIDYVIEHVRSVVAVGEVPDFIDDQDVRFDVARQRFAERRGTIEGMDDRAGDDYRAMTVNERLFVAGLMDDFDRAVKGADVERLKAILRDVKLSDENIAAILKRVLPGKTT